MVTEQRFSEAMACGHCQNKAPMRIVGGYHDTTEQEERGLPPWNSGTIFELLKCPACGGITLRSYYWNDGSMDPGDEIDSQILYPSERTKPRGLPEGIARDYEAAQRIKTISPNAYGVLLGRVLEVICADRQAKGNTLHKKLQDLSARGEIPSKLIEVAQSLKDLRNVGAHASLGNLTSGEVPLLEDLTRAILEYVYSAPALAEAAVARLQALKHRSNEKPGREKA